MTAQLSKQLPHRGTLSNWSAQETKTIFFTRLRTVQYKKYLEKCEKTKLKIQEVANLTPGADWGYFTFSHGSLSAVMGFGN